MSTTTPPLRPGPAPEAPLEWFSTSRPQLRDDVEVLRGLDDRPMLFVASTGRYLAVGKDVETVLRTLDGTATGAELVERLGPRAATAGPRLASLAYGLRQAGALVEAPEAVRGRRGVARFARREHLLRLPLTRDVGAVLEPLVAPLRAVRGAVLVAVWSSLAVVGLGLGVLALATAGAGWSPPAHAWVALPLLFVQVAAHELSHAVVCQYLRVPVREAGIGLMLYVMPVGYVDRTDAYRVRGRRSRAFLSLAGPVNDQLWFGITAVVALTADGPVGDVAFLLLVPQALLTLMNLNPVTPSDGYHAACALAGEVDVRGRALSRLTHHLLRLPLPQHLRVPARRRRLEVGYAVACLLFFLLLVGLVARGLAGLLGALA